MDRPDFTLSEQKRIALVHSMLLLWMKNNDIQMFEVKRAIAMNMRLEDERKHEQAIAERSH